jgi:hypothetical protein
MRALRRLPALSDGDRLRWPLIGGCTKKDTKFSSPQGPFRDDGTPPLAAARHFGMMHCLPRPGERAAVSLAPSAARLT